MIYTFEQLKKELFKPVYEVYDVFKNYFSEEHVDIQGFMSDEDIKFFYADSLIEDGKYEIDNLEDYRPVLDSPFILVWWPNVTVTNEYDKSIDIQDLYCKIPLTYTGRIYSQILFNRATYTKVQYMCNYLHSHVNGVNKQYPDQFSSCCLGRGPLKDTIYSIKNMRSFDETIWMEFCRELDLYVRVESVEGVPYKKLEQVTLTNKLYKCTVEIPNNISYQLQSFNTLLGMEFLKDFIKYYVKNGHFQVMYLDGFYTIAMDSYEVILDMSNSFIKYFNTYYKGSINNITPLINNNQILVKVKAKDGNLYWESDNYQSYFEPDTSIPVCTFKGEAKYIHIIDEGNDKSEDILILSPEICSYIICQIINLINLKYENNRTYREGKSPLTGKTKCYL